MNENEQNLADYLTYVRGVPRREAELRARKATQRLESTSPEDREELERAVGEHILREHRPPEAVANDEYEQGVDFQADARGAQRPPALPQPGAPERRPAPSDDVGISVVNAIAEMMGIDEEWSTRDERGFTWWGKDYAQRVWSEPGFDDDGFEIFRIHARAQVVRGFEPTGANLAKLNALSMVASTSGFLVDPDEGTVEPRGEHVPPRRDRRLGTEMLRNGCCHPGEPTRSSRRSSWRR